MCCRGSHKLAYNIVMNDHAGCGCGEVAYHPSMLVSTRNKHHLRLLQKYNNSSTLNTQQAQQVATLDQDALRRQTQRRYEATLQFSCERLDMRCRSKGKGAIKPPYNWLRMIRHILLGMGVEVETCNLKGSPTAEASSVITPI